MAEFFPMPGQRVVVVDAKVSDDLDMVGEHGLVVGGRVGIFVRLDRDASLADLEGPSALIVEREQKGWRPQSCRTG